LSEFQICKTKHKFQEAENTILTGNPAGTAKCPLNCR